MSALGTLLFPVKTEIKSVKQCIMSTRIIKKETSDGFYQRIYIQINIVKYCVCNVGGLVGSNISLFVKCVFPEVFIVWFSI